MLMHSSISPQKTVEGNTPDILSSLKDLTATYYELSSPVLCDLIQLLEFVLLQPVTYLSMHPRSFQSIFTKSFHMKGLIVCQPEKLRSKVICHDSDIVSPLHIWSKYGHLPVACNEWLCLSDSFITAAYRILMGRVCKTTEPIIRKLSDLSIDMALPLIKWLLPIKMAEYHTWNVTRHQPFRIAWLHTVQLKFVICGC